MQLKLPWTARTRSIVAADVIGSGAEQVMLVPMIEQAGLRQTQTLITADAGYFSDDNVQALRDRGIPALIADNGMRQRDKRFADQASHEMQGEVLHDKRGTRARPITLFRPEDFIFHDERTASCPAGKALTGSGAICGQRGRRFQRCEANAQDCARFTLHGKGKVTTQWQLYCLVHNIEKIATKAMRTG